MTEHEARREAVRHWWTKANESLAAARRELAAGALAFAINRAYYALFYAVTALFLEQGREFSKHAGVRAAFNQPSSRLVCWKSSTVSCTTRSSRTVKPATTWRSWNLILAMSPKRLPSVRHFLWPFGR